MRVVIQRVSEANVSIDNSITGAIGKGLLILLGIEEGDASADIDWLCPKIAKLRIYNDENGLMNLSFQDVDGEILLISQFTLFASSRKGNRPSYIRAARPETAIPLYEEFILKMEKEIQKKVQTGVFGADMKIHLINDGPVTIIIDSKMKE